MGEGSAVTGRTHRPITRLAQMSIIYVNTDNSNHHKKIYKAAKVGKSADACEKKMQEVVRKLVTKAAGFTTDKSVSHKGYTIRIEVTKVEKSGADTKYTVHPEIVRFPSKAGKGGKGAEMVSTRTTDPTITLQGSSEGMLLDGMEAVTEDIVTKSLPLMRVDFARR
jgi:hypothetical protein